MSEYKEAVVARHDRSGNLLVYPYSYKKEEQEISMDRVLLPEHVRNRMMVVIGSCSKQPKVKKPMSTASSKTPMSTTSSNPTTPKSVESPIPSTQQQSSSKANPHASSKLNPKAKPFIPKWLRSQIPSVHDPVSQLPMKKRKSVPAPTEQKSKTCHDPMDISVTSEASTSDSGATILEADPMHNIQALFEGDEIIATNKRQGVVVSVGNNNLFGVRFEGDSRITFVTRQKVAFYKRTQTPQGNRNIDPEKCYILQLGTTSMFHLLEFCTFKEIARLSCVCKDLREAAEDSFLWRNVFSRYNKDRLAEIMAKSGQSREQLATKSMKNWKYAFMCEKEQIFQALRCFHTKMNFQETTLGIPLWYTINPKKRCIQYIKSSCDLLGKEAYNSLKVRKTIAKEEFTDWMPAYITLDHFKRSLPDLMKTIRKL